MTIKSLFFAILAVSMSSCSQVNKEESKLNDTPNKYVNNFIGTGGHGHTYPGAQLPFGMVQLSPDNGVSGWDWVSGYHYSDSVIVGFSHTHLSGVGIGDLQDISIMPSTIDYTPEEIYKDRTEKPYMDFYSHDSEVARPGYYHVLLEKNNIDIELTTTNRTGFHRYTFNNKGKRNILVDLQYAQNWDVAVSSKIIFESKNSISGYRFSKGWAKDQKLFFVMQFSKDIKNIKKLGEEDKETNSIIGKGVKALLEFDDNEKEILVKVGISSVSIENAKLNLKTENDAWDFDSSVAAAEKEWANSLGKIVVKGDSETNKTVFYTSLYHSELAPTTYSDVNGQYRGADGKIHTADFDYMTGLSIWDVFRTQNPLITILNPKKAVDIANTMLAHFDETGILPVWVLAGNETNTMTGYHSVSMLAEVIMKDLKGLDYEKAFQAMKTTMLQDQRGLKQLREYGYVPFDTMDESVTISLELAYNDYGVAMVAKKLGKTKDYEYFLNRSLAYQKLFDKSVGFMRGKDTKGEWRKEFDPKHSAHRVGTDYTEGNAWQHSWFVLHDIQGLINEFGSDEAFEKQLSQLFNESSEITGEDVSPDITGLIGQYAHGNEPSHHIAYMYNYVGMPWKTQEMVHRIMKEQYPNTPDGISGNEDMGQMSAWYVVSALGFYPVNPTDGNFILGTPLFKESEIKLDNGKSFVIIANNLTDDNFYVQSVKLNGNNIDRSYITYNEIMSGGTLEFEMGPEPNKTWATSVTSRPPSISKAK